LWRGDGYTRDPSQTPRESRMRRKPVLERQKKRAQKTREAKKGSPKVWKGNRRKKHDHKKQKTIS